MSWFDEQIRERKIKDSEAMKDAFDDIASAVLGKRAGRSSRSDRIMVTDAMSEILRYFRLSSTELPEDIKGRDEQIDYLLRPHGIMSRRVTLSEGWYKDCSGPLLGELASDHSIVALIPGVLGGYHYCDPETGNTVKLSKKTEGNLMPDAMCFYQPFPLRKIDIGDILRFIVNSLPVYTIAPIGVISVIVLLLGMITPNVSYFIMSKVVTGHSVQLLLSITIFSVCLSVSTLIFNAVKSLLDSNVSTLLNLRVQSATMARVMSLPASFFKDYSSGQLSYKMSCMESMCSMLFNSVFTTSITSLLSLIYIYKIFQYAPSLVVPALIIIAATLVVSVSATFSQMKITRKLMEVSGKESGMIYSMITGVQKVKLAGAEKRMFSRWLGLYSKEAQLTYNKPLFLRIYGVISTGITLCGTIILYYCAVKNGVSIAQFNAFNTSYAMISAAFMSLAGVATTAASIKPVFEEVKPIMDAEPELSVGRKIVTKLNGAIELNNISFRYNENSPNIIDNLSLNIKPGQYVALVGSTGCGKSTLVRIILGFEQPQKGSVYFDRHDIKSLDLKSLRSKIGVVMQNGKLFYGDIFSNITIAAPWLTLDDAWAAAEIAGVADDIRAMPMGMHTMVTEGQGGFSGGQKQRLMIARAVAPKPKILIFDEATSALDNVTQKKVSEALDGLKCTRIVIAHRLSTIRQCDRILVLDKGKIIEDGTYDELIAKGGFFAELIERQRVDK
ncbi:MAG: ATP-binding cassette domain-containing protein [Eubacteriales bacterium]|nr:ATP-binding cassette domain-containing protein [Eubacteriales bacterium]